MVCGLLWLGSGLLGLIGVTFNDAFGRALARQGAACVQLHTPQRHLKGTRLMELALLACLPLCLLPGLRFGLLAADLAMLLSSRKDLYLAALLLLPGLLDALLATSLAVPMLLLGPLGWFLCVAHMSAGLLVIPLLHFAFRLGQYWRLGPHFPHLSHEVRGVRASWPPGLPQGGLSGGRLGASDDPKGFIIEPSL